MTVVLFGINECSTYQLNHTKCIILHSNSWCSGKHIVLVLRPCSDRYSFVS